MESVKLYRESFSSMLKKHLFVSVILLLLFLWFSLKNNKAFLIILFPLILIYSFVSFFLKMKQKVAIKNDIVLIPGTSYSYSKAENTNKYTIFFRKSILKGTLFQFNKANIKKIYIVSGEEKKQFNDDKKLNFWDEEYISTFK